MSEAEREELDAILADQQAEIDRVNAEAAASRVAEAKRAAEPAPVPADDDECPW